MYHYLVISGTANPLPVGPNFWNICLQKFDFVTPKFTSFWTFIWTDLKPALQLGQQTKNRQFIS